MAAAAQKIIDRVNAEYGEVFARSDVELNGDKDPGNRTEETNLGDLITDAMLWSLTEQNPGSITEVDPDNIISLTNGGGIRAWIHQGDISKKDINTVLPFGNTVAVVYVTGAELLEALEASTFSTPGAVGAFPQVAGIDFTIFTDKAYDANTDKYPGSTYYGPHSIQRVVINSINGKPFDLNAKYAVITNNFVAAGGDTYYAFAAASSQFDTGRPLDEVLMEYITEKLGGVVGEQYAEPQGRITIANCTEGSHDFRLVNAKAATCGDDGYTGDVVCAGCGEVQSKGAVIKATGGIDALVNAGISAVGGSKAVAAVVITLIGLLVTMGIGTSFGTVPVLAVLFVPMCSSLGFPTPATILLISAAAALGDAGSPASDTTLGPTSGLNADGQHDHIRDTCIPTFIAFNIPIMICAILMSQVL